MKKIIIILFTLAVLPACSNFLDQAPTGEQTKGYIFEDYTRAQRYMDQLYISLPRVWTSGSSYFSQSNPGFLESATDMAEYTATYGAANNSFNVGNWFNSAAYSEVAAPWGNAYENLRMCYMFLENIDNFKNEPYSNNVSRKVTMLGEVQFMIAFNYFELLKRYGGVPLVKDVLTLETNLKVPRATYDETCNYIIENVDKAISVLPDVWPQNDFGRITKVAAMALKSRVLLYAASPLNNPTNDIEKWKKAAAAARDCIDFCDSRGLNQLMPEYRSIFMGSFAELKPELIMPVVNSYASSFTFNSFVILYGQATPGDGFQGYGSNSPTQDFVDRFEVIKYDAQGNAIGTEKFDWNNPNHVKNMYKNRDPRFYYTVLYNNVYWIKRNIETWREGTAYGKDRNPKNHLFSRTGYYLRKFWPATCYSSEQVGSGQMIAFYFRYGEVLLNYAEAMNEAFGADVDGLQRENTITSRDVINRIRGRLVCPPSKAIGGSSDKYYQVKVERQTNPNFPVLTKGMPKIPAGLSQAEMRERVKNERTIELCFEGHYLYDILRWKDGAKHMKSIYGVDPVKDGDSYTYNRVLIEDRVFDEGRMYLYPIPKEQVYSMEIAQNPGW
ncbi:MAG: RagB/SusD family nutrient uptake outer membrane protein [Bacteroidales bacterium]